MLPFWENQASGKKIAVVGPNADDLYNQLGDYTPPLRRDDGITVLDGMKLIFKESDIRFSQGCYLRKRDENLLKEAVDTVKTVTL